MKRIYLDSNILIAHFATDKSEETKKKLVENALAVFSQLKDAQFPQLKETSPDLRPPARQPSLRPVVPAYPSATVYASPPTAGR